MSLPVFDDCRRCRGKCSRIYTVGAERGGRLVTLRKFKCVHCGTEHHTVENRAPWSRRLPKFDPAGWPRPNRKWSELGLSGDAFA